MVLAAAAMMIPASLLMQRMGRRFGFLVGTALGMGAGLVAAAAVHWHRFEWFVVAHALFGAYQGLLSTTGLPLPTWPVQLSGPGPFRG